MYDTDTFVYDTDTFEDTLWLSFVQLDETYKEYQDRRLWKDKHRPART